MNTTEINRAVDSHPSLPLDFHLTHSRLDTERYLFYVTYWDKSCQPSLSSVFQQPPTPGHGSLILNDAILALSACNMSRACPEVLGCGGVRRPNRTHHLQSQLFYCSAIRRLRKLGAAECRSNILHILAALVLLCYLESSMCNFHGYHCHLNGIHSLLNVDASDASNARIGREFLTTLEQVRYYNWWIRIHFSTLNFQGNQSLLHGSFSAFGEDDSPSTERTTFLAILCESYRLASKAFILWWQTHGSSFRSTQQYLDPYGEDYTDLLKTESQKLDIWVSRRRALGCPFDQYPPDIKSTSPRSSHSPSKHQPLCFLSHDAAMNHAYYAAARIIQSRRGFETSNTDNPFFQGRDDVQESWMVLLLRTVAGIDFTHCARQNVYTIGISGLLLACILQGISVTAGVWIESWLEDFHHATHVPEEGSLPISQIIRIVAAINRQRQQRDYDIFAISLVEEDDGGKGKFSSYANQNLDEIVLYGRCRRTGRAVSERVSV